MQYQQQRTHMQHRRLVKTGDHVKVRISRTSAEKVTVIARSDEGPVGNLHGFEAMLDCEVKFIDSIQVVSICER